MPVILSGCLGTRHLKENERLLLRQRIVNVPSTIDREEMSGYYAQRENRKFLWVMTPLVEVYYWGERNYDPEKYVKKKAKVDEKFDRKIARTGSQKKINEYEFRRQKKIERLNNLIENGNLRMQWGEPVAVFDSALMASSAETFEDYLFSKGYFRNRVTAQVNYPQTGLNPRTVTVAYIAEPGPAFAIDSIIYEVPDSLMLRLILQSKRNSLLKEGKRYDQSDLTLERDRMDALMRDNGYYDFSRQYIDYQIDTAALASDHRILLKIIVNEPAKRGYHKQFTIDSVNFTTDAGPTAGNFIERKSRTYRDINFHYAEKNYNLKILSQRVFLQTGQVYSRTRTFNTQRQLSNVDAFKFININFDTAGGRFIANIFSSPLPRYEWSNEAGVSVTQGFPGPFYSLAFRKRNIFKGLENFELSGRFGFEGVASATAGDVYKSLEAGVNASLTFPQFLFPFNERTRFKLAEYNPKTRLTTGYSFTSRPEYTRSAISLNAAYTWQNNRNRAYSLTPLSISVIDTSSVSGAFKSFLSEQLEAGNFTLYNSFRPSFVNSAIFSVAWNQNEYGNNERSSGFIRATIENGGLIWNWLDTALVTQFDLQYFKYLRFGLDIRRINVINSNTTVAYRFNGGLAYSYATNKSLPYEKFFFAGGSNSVRAWRPRRLGPGSYKPEFSTKPDVDGLYSYSIEKPADILLEASLEVRKKLFGFVSGAIFIDAGNVWLFETLTKRALVGGVEQEIANGNAQFRLDQFYKEIAVGTGFGLRFDFTFLILRFDVGMKVVDPARDENDRFVLDKVRFWKPYAVESNGVWTDFKEPVIYNVGIGYSF